MIWSFGKNMDGAESFAGLAIGGNGALYGTTQYGGSHGYGTVFRLVPSGAAYREEILWSFGLGVDGRYPAEPLMLGRHGTIYGTTGGGGNGCPTGCGTVFRLTPSVSGYTETILWRFHGGSDGSLPSSALTVGASGALYGVTYFGGGPGCDGYGCGTVFELTRSGSAYAGRALWHFGQGIDGEYPDGNVVLGTRGRLFGMTQQGGAHLVGTFYELVPHGQSYAEKILWNFNTQSGGFDPAGPLITDAQHRIYGTTNEGGTNEWAGTVFRFTP